MCGCYLSPALLQTINASAPAPVDRRRAGQVEHSEALQDQELSLTLFEGDPNFEWARKHWEIIRRFGRFPHRNAALGRASTPEETAFLKDPGSDF